MNARFREGLRIIWTIAAKDIVDAIRNRTTLTLVLSVLFTVVIYRFLPALESGDSLPKVRVYDAGESSLVEALDGSLRLNSVAHPSQESMEHYLTRSDVPELGLLIPADFDRVLLSDQQPELDGYVLHWVSDSDANELKSYVEQEIAELAGRPVRINLDGNIIYTQKESTGYAFLTAIGVTFSLILIGVTLVPYLILGEKQARTMDALLVSPASVGQVTIGKALAGTFYGLTASAVALVLNAGLITHWALAVLTAICGTLFSVALGLLMGSLIENGQHLILWAWILLIPLLMPVFLSVMVDLLPTGVIAVLFWVPTVALSRVLRVSFSDSAPLADFGPELALIAGCAALILAAVTWAVRRSDR